MKCEVLTAVNMKITILWDETWVTPDTQNLMSSCLLSKNVMIKIYRTIIFPVVLNGCYTWSLT